MTEPGWKRDERINEREDNFNDEGPYRYRVAWEDEGGPCWEFGLAKKNRKGSDLEEDKCTQNKQS